MLVIEPDRIVPHRAGAGPCKLLMNPVGKFRFGKTMLFEVRGREAMHQRGFGLRQLVRGGAAVAHDRIAHDMQVTPSVRTPANCTGRYRLGLSPDVS